MVDSQTLEKLHAVNSVLVVPPRAPPQWRRWWHSEHGLGTCFHWWAGPRCSCGREWARSRRAWVSFPSHETAHGLPSAWHDLPSHPHDYGVNPYVRHLGPEVGKLYERRCGARHHEVAGVERCSERPAIQRQPRACPRFAPQPRQSAQTMPVSLQCGNWNGMLTLIECLLRLLSELAWVGGTMKRCSVFFHSSIRRACTKLILSASVFVSPL